MKDKCIKLLEQTAKTPKMFCTNKEALLVRVTTILEIFITNFNASKFYKKHLKTKGTTYLYLNDTYDNEWASNVINDGIILLKSIKE